MTYRQKQHIEDLSTEYQSVRARTDHETMSVYVDCFDVGLPERCLVCGREDIDHIDPRLELEHAFRVAMPVATYRVAPSGFRQNLTPLEPVA